jgi:organic radical activating enzyme
MKIKNIIYKLFLLLNNGISLSLAINWKCNMNCDYCINTLVAGKLHNKTTTLNKWIKYIEEFPIKIKQVSITGGEPTLYKDVDKLVNYLLSKQINVVMYSNLYAISAIDRINKSNRFKIYTTYHKGMPVLFLTKLNVLRTKHLIICKEFNQLEESTEGSQKHDILGIEHSKRKVKNWLFVSPDLKLFTSCYDRLVESKN